jgi:transcriptional regulator GlxA family with amidase domain
VSTGFAFGSRAKKTPHLERPRNTRAGANCESSKKATRRAVPRQCISVSKGQVNSVAMDVRVKAVIQTMDQLIANQLSISSLSKDVNMSPSGLRQLFKRETGHSPMRYLRNLRMQRARELLKGSFLSFKEITFLTGVKDVSHFVRDFKNQYGVRPSELRERGRGPAEGSMGTGNSKAEAAKN